MENQTNLSQEMPGAPDEEFTINPKTGMIVSDGHEYANTPRVRAFVKRANAIRNSLPPIQEEHVRLWRGNRPNEVGENPSFTNSLEGIALPFLDGYGGMLSYVEVPKEDLNKYVQTGVVASNAEFILPADLAKKATPIKETSVQEAK